MHVLLIDNGSRYLKQLKGLFSKDRLEVVNWKTIHSNKARDADLVVLSGGHAYSVVGNPEKWKSEVAFIRKCTKPIIGICLGFELMAYAYGSTLKRMKNKEKGTVKIKMKGKTFHVFENHRWVVEKTGAKLVSLARSKDGVEAIRHRTKPIYGFQFHPEMFIRKTDGKRLFAQVIRNIQSK